MLLLFAQAEPRCGEGSLAAPSLREPTACKKAYFPPEKHASLQKSTLTLTISACRGIAAGCHHGGGASERVTRSGREASALMKRASLTRTASFPSRHPSSYREPQLTSTLNSRPNTAQRQTASTPQNSRQQSQSARTAQTQVHSHLIMASSSYADSDFDAMELDITFQMQQDAVLPQSDTAPSLDKIPDDVLLEIWTHLEDPGALARTSRRFFIVSRDGHLWARWLLSRYPLYEVLFQAIARPKLFSEALLERLINGGAVLSRNLVQLLHHRIHSPPSYTTQGHVRWEAALRLTHTLQSFNVEGSSMAQRCLSRVLR